MAFLSAKFTSEFASGALIGPADFCVHAATCSGCPLIDLLPSERLEHKRLRVVKAAGRYAENAAWIVADVVPAPSEIAYRTRAKLMVGPSAELGLFAKPEADGTGDHVVVDVPECLVLAPAIAHVAAHLRASLPPFKNTLGAAGFGSWLLRAIDLREVVAHAGLAEPRVLVTIVVTAGEDDASALFVSFANELLRGNSLVIGVAINHHDGVSPQVLGGHTALLAGTAHTLDRIGEAEFPATFGAFVQAHRVQSARIQRVLLGHTEGLRPGAKILDVYGGSGVLAIALAARGFEVTTVDSFVPALRYLEEFALAKNLPIVTMAGDAAEVLSARVKRAEAFELVLVNPPRRGLHPLVREALAKLSTPTLVCVSCDPDTLTRDLDHLALLGLHTTSLAPYDLIPLTDEVETIAVLQRRPLRSPHVIAETATMVVVDKSAHEPTVPSVTTATHLLARVQLMEGFAHARHVFDLAPGISGAVVFGRSPEHAEAWIEAFADADTRRVYIALARGLTPLKGVIHKTYTGRIGDSGITRTRYRRLAIAAGHSLVRIVAEVGDTHALRRHMASLGHGILGDERFGHSPSNRYFQERHSLDRLFLHLVRIECTSPETGERLFLESPLAGDLRGVLERIAGDEIFRVLDGRHALGVEGFSSVPPAALEGAGEMPTIPRMGSAPRIFTSKLPADSGGETPDGD